MKGHLYKNKTTKLKTVQLTLTCENDDVQNYENNNDTGNYMNITCNIHIFSQYFSVDKNVIC